MAVTLCRFLNYSLMQSHVPGTVFTELENTKNCNSWLHISLPTQTGCIQKGAQISHFINFRAYRTLKKYLARRWFSHFCSFRNHSSVRGLQRRKPFFMSMSFHHLSFHEQQNKNPKETATRIFHDDFFRFLFFFSWWISF